MAKLAVVTKHSGLHCGNEIGLCCSRCLQCRLSHICGHRTSDGHDSKSTSRGWGQLRELGLEAATQTIRYLTDRIAVRDVKMLQRQWIALAPLAQPWRVLAPMSLGDSSAGDVVQADKLQPGNVVKRCGTAHLMRTQIERHNHTLAIDSARHKRERVEAGQIKPVGVVECKQQRGGCGGRAAQLQHGQRHQRLVARSAGHAECRIQRLTKVCVELGQVVEDRLYQLTKDEIARVLVSLMAAGPQYRETIRLTAHPLQQSRLADAGFTLDGYGRGETAAGTVEHLKEMALLKFAPDNAAHSRNLATECR